GGRVWLTPFKTRPQLISASWSFRTSYFELRTSNLSSEAPASRRNSQRLHGAAMARVAGDLRLARLWRRADVLQKIVVDRHHHLDLFAGGGLLGFVVLRAIGLRADVAVVAHHAKALRERTHDRHDLLLGHVLRKDLEICRRRCLTAALLRGRGLRQGRGPNRHGHENGTR